MENTHRRPSGKRPKKRRFRGNQFMKVCSHTYVAERKDKTMRCIGQGLESLKTFCAVMSLPNPVEQKSYDVINNKLSRVMKEVAEESMKRAAVEENSSSPDNLLKIAAIAANLATSVFNDGNQVLITILEKFGLKINRNVCVPLAERDNRRIFTSRQRRLELTFEARRAKKIKKSKEIELFQEQEDISYDPGAF
ncbi:hypothetical protein TNCV_2128571 [Trichonephila clavipes]|nr:hypothetical protein TNCV_2128571 [Trichonephila clavipes]